MAKESVKVALIVGLIMLIGGSAVQLALLRLVPSQPVTISVKELREQLKQIYGTSGVDGGTRNGNGP